MGTCIYCGRDLEQVLAQPTPELSLTRSLANNDAEISESEWHPSFWNGDMGIAKGWYIRRAPASGATEWLKDPAGVVVRTDTESAALRTIAGLVGENIN